MKQAIIVNLAVPMSIGRLSAQIAHASLLAVLDKGECIDGKFTIDVTDPGFKDWLVDHNFTKAVLKSWGDDALLTYYNGAITLGLRAGIMKEAGHITAVAIGPCEDAILQSLVHELVTL